MSFRELGLPGQSSGAESDQGAFQCGFCKKHYARVDHLTRHVRSHTKEKPYTCEVCTKSFARPDLLKRHAVNHEPGSLTAGSKRSRPADAPSSVRVSEACKACALSKLKCEEDKPCRRCVKKGLECAWASGQRHESVESETNELDGDAAPALPIAGNAGLDEMDMSADLLGHSFPGLDSNPTNNSLVSRQQIKPAVQDNSLVSRQQKNPRAPQFPDLDGSGVLELEGNFFPDFLYDVVIPPFANQYQVDPPGYLSQAYTPRGFMDYGFNENVDLDGLDFEFLNEINTKPTAVDLETSENPLQQELGSGLAIGADAFQRSTLVGWTPRHRDHGFAEEANFNVPHDAGESPELQLNVEKEVLTEKLGLPARDKILAMVIEGCRPSSIPNVVASFPSTEILDSLIQIYFTWHGSLPDSWIHLPTFRISDKRPEVLATYAAAGALRAPIPIFRKLGSALRESVRLAVPRRFEEDNTATRELQIIQAYILQLDLGLWSGNRRKIEIAESFSQPGVTMIRRARQFHRSAYRTNPPTRDDDEDTTHQKWLAWSEMESRKRLAFHVFVRDAQSSMTLNTNPLISYTEFNLPLPDSRDLWEAGNARQWKERWLRRGAPDRLPSLLEVLQDMSHLGTYQAYLDMQSSSLVVLYGIWSLISEYQRFDALSKGSGHWNSLVLSSRHQELCQILQHFRLISSEWLHPPLPQVRMVLELVSMYLYMSVEELQLYAGKEDKEAARKVNDSARQWINKPASRQAVWHAGQVIQSAKNLPKGHLRDFNAIAVYHASLAFWSYAVVSRVQQAVSQRRDALSSSGTAAASSPVWLDASETAEVQKFVTLQRGEPSIRYKTSSASLADTVGVMKIVTDILRENSGQELPEPLVENVSQLLHDLGQAARTT